jgi:hypothetical protein
MAENAGTQHPKFQAQKWKPGQSGNPGGRPKGQSLQALVNSILDEAIALPETGELITKRELVGRVIVDEWLKRNGMMLREYLAREWPAPLRHEIGGLNGGPITIADYINRAREKAEEERTGSAPSVEPEISAEEVGPDTEIVAPNGIRLRMGDGDD